MKKTITFLILLLPLFSQAQGIKFEEGLTWEQVKAKAKQENKYIFIDAYATWCVPCKKMDKEVYTDPKVGESINQKFIAIKVQMDTSKNDAPEIQNWYSDARLINQTYQVTSYPSFLFFSSDGKLLHKDFGYRNPDEFNGMVKIATDPNSQYYSLVSLYKKGGFAYSQMPSLAQKAKSLKERDFANLVAQDYLKNYLYKQNDKIIFSKENLEFMRSFVQSSKELGFRLFYKNSGKIDKIMNRKDYSQSLIDYVIDVEEVSPTLKETNETALDAPDWSILLSRIAKKYNSEYAKRIILNAQLRWYEFKSNWKMLARYHIEKMEIYGVDTVSWGKYTSNSIMWNVFFKHNNNVSELSKATSWMEIILKSDPYYVNMIDTYANLLYKIGRTREAIRMQEIASKLAPDNKGLQEALTNMKAGEPTYVKDGAVWSSETLPTKTITKQ